MSALGTSSVSAVGALGAPEPPRPAPATTTPGEKTVTIIQPWNTNPDVVEERYPINVSDEYEPLYFDPKTIVPQEDISRLHEAESRAKQNYERYLSNLYERVSTLEDEANKIEKSGKLGDSYKLIGDIIVRELMEYGGDVAKAKAKQKGSQIVDKYVSQTFRDRLKERMAELSRRTGLEGRSVQTATATEAPINKAIRGGTKGIARLNELLALLKVVSSAEKRLSEPIEIGITGGYSSQHHKRVRDAFGANFLNDYLGSIPVLGSVSSIYGDVVDAGASLDQALFSGNRDETDQQAFNRLKAEAKKTSEQARRGAEEHIKFLNAIEKQTGDIHRQHTHKTKLYKEGDQLIRRLGYSRSRPVNVANATKHVALTLGKRVSDLAPQDRQHVRDLVAAMDRIYNVR